MEQNSVKRKRKRLPKGVTSEMLKDVRHLSDKLKDPTLKGKVYCVIERASTGKLDFKYFKDELDRLLGIEGHFISYILSRNLYDLIDKLSLCEIPNETLEFFKDILNKYGLDFEDAHIAALFPNDWKHLNWDYYYYQRTKSVVISINIYKRNGEKILLEGPAKSMFNFASTLVLRAAVDTYRVKKEVPELTSEITKEDIDEMEEHLDLLRKILKEKPEKA
jgi:hypothetical protein